MPKYGYFPYNYAIWERIRVCWWCRHWHWKTSLFLIKMH